MRLSVILLSAASLAVPAAVHAAPLEALDVCDALGLTGLTISSDVTCLQISGGVYYEFYWGNYETALDLIGANELGYSGEFVTAGDNGFGPAGEAEDWNSYLEDWITLTATTGSDAGPAKAVVELYHYHDIGVIDEVLDYDDKEFSAYHAYVSIGDATVLSAGLQDSIARLEDDDALTWVASFLSDAAEGVAFDNPAFGSFATESIHAVSLVHSSNGWEAGAALESLDLAMEGHAVGFVSYVDDVISAHLTGVAAKILDGGLDDFALHAGLTATLDAFKLRGALAANTSGWWNALASAEAKLDIFTLSGTLDATSESEIGAVAAAEVALNEMTTIKGALRYLDSDTGIADDEGIEVRARVELKVTETVTLGGEAGRILIGAGAVNGAQDIYDGLVDITYAPNDSNTFSASIAANTLGAYKVGVTADNSFQ